MAVSAYTGTGSKATSSPTLAKGVFSVEIDNHDLLKQAYVANRANSRINLAQTLKRGQVSGGGKKPWRQKGTGNARTGSIRNPIWRGGGITFGPQGIENYSKKMNAKAQKQALRQALTLAAKSGRLAVIEKFVISSGKTSDAQKLVNKLSEDTRVTFVAEKTDEKTVQATANLNDVKVVKSARLSVSDVLDAGMLVITKDALTALESRLGGTK